MLGTETSEKYVSELTVKTHLGMSETPMTKFYSHQFAWARKHLNEKLIRKHPGVLNHATLIWMWLTDRKKNYSFIEREGNGTCVSEGKISAT